MELQVLDAESLDLCPEGPRLLEHARAYLGPFIKPEAYQSMIELVTPICEDLEAVQNSLEENLHLLERLAREEGLLLLAASLHPFAPSRGQRVWEDERYHRIFQELQLVGRRFIAQGLHVHLGMPDAETAVRVYRGLRLYLPLFLALSTSSPFYEGQATGLHSYRSKLFEALPLAGLPRDFTSWEEFARLVEELIRLGIISGIRDLWWDIRLQPALGTVEVRVYDLPARFQEILALVALTQALAHHLMVRPVLSPTSPEVLAFGKWQAARHGLKGQFVEPVKRRRLPFEAGLLELLNTLQEDFQALGLSAFLPPLLEILTQGTASQKMLSLYQRGLSWQEIIRYLLKRFWT